MKVFRIGLLAICILSVALFGGYLWRAWRWNLTALDLFKGKVTPISATDLACSEIWFNGMASGRRGDQAAQRRAFEQALGCSPEYISMVQAVMSADQGLAELATQRYPDQINAWFWLGDAAASVGPLAARPSYLRILAISPQNGLAWCRLGSTYEQTGEYEKAVEAFLSCCLNGDPGANGCYHAGGNMERLGDFKQAIAYYRLSRWQGALDRAQELEKSLEP
jgi:tetratricopeptide (TPR) repeat protein